MEFNLKFYIDVNSKLIETVSIDSKGIQIEKEIKNLTHAVVDKVNKKIIYLKQNH